MILKWKLSKLNVIGVIIFLNQIRLSEWFFLILDLRWLSLTSFDKNVV